MVYKVATIEANLATNAANDSTLTLDYVQSHLSIHVRAYTDFSAVIPVKPEAYAVYNKTTVAEDRKEIKFEETQISSSLSINGTDVKINIVYGEDNITVSSEGVNEEVVSYLNKTYGDGLTIEVFNYYNKVEEGAENNSGTTVTSTVTRDELKAALASATVSWTEANQVKQFVCSYGYNNNDRTKEVYGQDPEAVTIAPADAMELTKYVDKKASDKNKAIVDVWR